MDYVSILESIENVDNSILKSDKTWEIILKDQENFWKSPGDIFLAFKRPTDEAVSISRSAEILNHFTELSIGIRGGDTAPILRQIGFRGARSQQLKAYGYNERPKYEHERIL